MPTATNVLVITAQADTDQSAPPGAANRWCVEVCDGHFAGLFAHGDTLHDARSALAEAVWLAAKNDPKVDDVSICAVRVLTVTRKTFHAAVLDYNLTKASPPVALSPCPRCGLAVDPATPHTCAPEANP